MKSESATLSERPDVLIVAPPRQAKLQAIVLVGDPQAVTNGRPAVGERQRVFVLAGEVDDACAAHRPVAGELHAPCHPEFFLVAKGLNRRVDVAVPPQAAAL